MKRTRRAAAEPPAAAPPTTPRWVLAVWGVALLAGIAPLWLARDLPMVDLPQHLYVLEVLRHLHDPNTPFPATFESHARLVPYLGYYAVVGALDWVMPLDVANRVWLTLAVLAFPLSVALLLDTLRRPTWPALLATPLAYSDSFAWGFVNTLMATPLAVATIALFVRAIERPAERRRCAAWAGAVALAGFLTHPAPLAFLALAVPWGLLTTRAPDDAPGEGVRGWLERRAWPLAGFVPLVLATLAWLSTAGRAPSAAPGGGPSALHGLLDPGAWVHETLPANLGAFLWLQSNQFQDGTDQIALLGIELVFVLALIARFVESAPPAATPSPAVDRLRRIGFLAIAFALFLTLPLAIRGQIQYLSPRFATLAALFGLALLPRLGPRSVRVFVGCAIAIALTSSVMLTRGYRRFAAEAAPLRRLAAACADHPHILGLIFQPNSAIVWRPVYLHSAVVLARLRDGVSDYSLANGNQIPLRYRNAPQAGAAAEWHPEQFDYARQGAAYDHFLLRGARPDSVFAGRLGGELEVAGHEGGWWLVRRHTSQASSDTSHSESAARVTRTPTSQPSGR
jgi:hypothetical protein